MVKVVRSNPTPPLSDYDILVTPMEIYTFADFQKRQEEVFDRAAKSPVLLTERSRPSHVIMSAETYQQLIEQFAELEDAIWGKAAELALKNYQMVGAQKFTKTLTKLANAEA